MSLAVFEKVKLAVQFASIIIFSAAVYMKYFRKQGDPKYRKLIGFSIVAIFGIEFIGEAFVPGFFVQATPWILRIAIFCYGVYLVFTREKNYLS